MRKRRYSSINEFDSRRLIKRVDELRERGIKKEYIERQIAEDIQRLKIAARNQLKKEISRALELEEIQ